MTKYTEYFEDLTLISFFLVIMFFLSGLNKIFNFDSTVENFRNKLNWNIDNNLYILAIIIVILIECIAPVAITYYIKTKKIDKIYAYLSVVSLIGFTILATIIYHPPDFSNYMKSIPFLSNITTIGGLLLLAKTINNNM
jgi:uncharacterized membrane protein YphA (DoxX/SURF4 family)